MEFTVEDGYFCPALAKAVKTMKKGEKVFLTVKPQCELHFCFHNCLFVCLFCLRKFIDIRVLQMHLVRMEGQHLGMKVLYLLMRHSK